jgi:DNA-binding NarL/FixJ family response regulator
MTDVLSTIMTSSVGTTIPPTSANGHATNGTAVTTAQPSSDVEIIPAPDAPVGVTGADELAVHAITRLLRDAGVEIVDALDAQVIVAVEPAARHRRELVRTGVPVVVVVRHEPGAEELMDLVGHGAHAVLQVTTEPSTLVRAISRVAAGDSGLTRKQSRLLAEALQHHRRTEVVTPVTVTARERDILLAIDRGQSVKQAARSLGISPKTVENTQRLLFRKLGVRNRAQAVASAYALGLLAYDDSATSR